MSKGAFLKKQRKRSVRGTNRQMTDDQWKAVQERHHRRQQHQRRMLVAAIVIFAAILLGMILWLCSNPLVGKWYMDSVTVYEFERNEKGRMILPFSEYEFRYRIVDDVLYIDFVNEGAKDAEYVYEIIGNTLVLNGGNATTKGIYTLKKGE